MYWSVTTLFFSILFAFWTKVISCQYEQIYWEEIAVAFFIALCNQALFTLQCDPKSNNMKKFKTSYLFMLIPFLIFTTLVIALKASYLYLTISALIAILSLIGHYFQEINKAEDNVPGGMKEDRNKLNNSNLPKSTEDGITL